jgi:hypothetical protein
MPASDEDAEHTIGRAATRKPTLDHNIVYLAGTNLKLRSFYAHEMNPLGFGEGRGCRSGRPWKSWGGTYCES